MKTEKEKMLRGEKYNPYTDRQLFAERLKCKNLCHKYNSIYPEMIGQRIGIAKKIIGKTNGLFLFEQPFFCDYGYNIELGSNFYSNYNLIILDAAKVTFGDNVLVGPNCGFYTTCHPIDPKERQEGIQYAKPIKIGNNVWFGSGVSVLPGVTIGDNSVIGAGSVVTKDIPANVVAAGNPCKIIKSYDFEALKPVLAAGSQIDFK